MPSSAMCGVLSSIVIVDFILRHPAPVNTGLWVDIHWQIDRQVSLTVNSDTVRAEWRSYQWLESSSVDMYIGTKHYQSGIV